MNKLPIITLSALIPVFLSITPQAFADPKHCYSYNECYNIGYGHGYTDRQDGYSPVEACDNHSHAYCGGYNQGYRDAASNDGNSGAQQGQYSQVNIHGDNNNVRVNEGENVQSSSGDGGGSGGHHGGGFQQVCKFLCSVIKIG